MLKCKGIRSDEDEWKSYYVVLSGHFLYFYSDKSSLLPYHYVHILNMQIMFQQEMRPSVEQENNLRLKLKNEETILINFGKKLIQDEYQEDMIRRIDKFDNSSDESDKSYDQMLQQNQQK